MEPREAHPFFETSAIIGAVMALAASFFLYGTLLLFPESIGGLLLACLGCCGLMLAPGLVATRLQVKKSGYTIELGRGALIGFVTGLVFAVVFSFMDVIWALFSINANELLLGSLEYFVREYGDPDAASDMEDMMAEAGSGGFSIGGLIMSSIVIGLLNLITGMIGTAVFKGEETLEL